MLDNLKKKFVKRPRLLHKNIDYLLNTFSMDIASLSAETGVPIATIFRMKKEANNPTISSIEPVADFFRIELNDLLYENIASPEYQQKKNIGKVRYLPALNLDEIKHWPIDLKSKMYFGTVGNISDNVFGIKISSGSMAPVFFKDTIVVVDPETNPNDSDYVFCKLGNDKIPVLRQVFIDGNTFLFKPVNPSYGDVAPYKKFEIIGTVIRSIENLR